MSHPDEGLIHAWLDGELDAAEAARIEELVRSDPAWAAAAAEARGFIAATSRIVRALDDVPANVIPAARAAEPRVDAKVIPLAAKPRGTPWWALRAAAVLVVVAGTVVVLRNGTPEVVEAGAGLATSAMNLKDSVVAPLAATPAPSASSAATTAPSAASSADRPADSRMAEQAAPAPLAVPSRRDAATNRAAAAEVDVARQLATEEKAKQSESAKLSVAGAAAPASVPAAERRVLGFAAKAMDPVSATEQCFREPVAAGARETGALHRVRVGADSVARVADERLDRARVLADSAARGVEARTRARAEASAEMARRVSVSMRVRGDTLLIGGADGSTVRALRVSCPSP